MNNTTATAAQIALTEAFAPFAADVEADYIAQVTREVSRLLQQYGRSVTKLSSQWGHDGGTYRALQTYIADLYPRRGSEVEPSLDVARLQKLAAQYAADTVAAFVYKLAKKLGDVSGVEVRHADTVGEYIVGATRNGKRVTVQQQRVFKFSNKGTPFHQWPARIYVDGNFTPAAAYEAAIS